MRQAEIQNREQQLQQKYRQMPDDAFYSSFRNSNWSGNMAQDERCTIIQEALRRDMAAQGVVEKDVPKISFHKEAEMPNCDGMFRSNSSGQKEIWISEKKVDSKFIKGEGEGFDLLNATLHEGRHAYQKLALEGKVQKGFEPDARSMDLLKANDHDVVVVSRGGTVQLGQTYLDGKGDRMSYNMYRLQYKERDADMHAVDTVGKIVDRQKQLVNQEKINAGISPSDRQIKENDLKDMKKYEKIADNYNVKHQIENANQMYFTPHADQDVDNAMLNLYEGRSMHPANPFVENQVKRESVQSYTRAYNQRRGLGTAPKIDNDTSLNASHVNQGIQTAQNSQSCTYTVSHGRRV